MEKYDPQSNPLNKYKIRNLVLSLIDSDYLPFFLAIIGVIAVLIHRFF